MSFTPPEPVLIDGSRYTFGIVAARYNAELVDALVGQVGEHLRASGAAPEAIEVWRVPGSNEIPVAVDGMLRRGGFDAVIALGVIVRGGTIHYEVISYSSADALHRVAVSYGVPVINGIVVAENEEQARERCLGAINRGAEFARAALEMASLRREKFPSSR